MPPSKQTLSNRKNDCTRLQGWLDRSGIFARVSYVESRGRYVVVRTNAAETELVAGRYEVVYAWIRGYLLGRYDESEPPADAPPEAPPEAPPAGS